MVRLTINGKPVEVEPGTTVLEAARILGIHIPTLCHVQGLRASTSCFVCCVQVAGVPRLSPACGLPVSDGMAVSTESEDIWAARRMALELLLSDHAGDCVAPCQARCPAGLDIAAFVFEIAREDLRQSMSVILEKLALPGALGRICPRLCEQGCRRCHLDEGLAIASLHRYAADKDYERTDPTIPPLARPTGKSIGIIGAGPSGLAAAFYLLQKGHQCTLYDAHALAGGMLRYGIPDYRLPREALDTEIAVIERMGAHFEMNRRWGSDFSLKELREKHDAVFVAIGAGKSQGLRCEGEELALPGIEFLELVAKDQTPELGSDVVVIGGGNTAMDAARSAVRLGASSVRVIYRRSRQEMPCLMEEVEAAELEGVHIDYLAAPQRLARGNGSMELTCQRMALGEPDESGRRRPVPQPGSEFTVECSTVIAAIGQSVDVSLASSEGLKATSWGIDTDPRSLSTSLPGVFAGGDAVLGADLAVRAVASGRLAAVSIDQYLSGQPVTGPREMMSIQLRAISEAERANLFREIEKKPRPQTATIDLQRRLKTFDEVESGLSGEQAATESHRCLSCGCRKADGCRIRTLATDYQADPYRFGGERRRFSQDVTHSEVIYEPGKCILCDACVQIAAQAGEELGVATIGRGFQVAVGVPFDKPMSEALLKVARKAAENCPTGALALSSARSCDLSCAHRHPADS